MHIIIFQFLLIVLFFERLRYNFTMYLCTMAYHDAYRGIQTSVAYSAYL